MLDRRWLVNKRDNTGGTYVYTFNAHGDVTSTVNYSGTNSGKYSHKYTYDAFGNESGIDANDTNPFRYCGEWWDKQTKRLYLRARDYDAATGRFTQQDGWEYGNGGDSLSLNLYVYCKNDPINFSDPSGHSTMPSGPSDRGETRYTPPPKPKPPTMMEAINKYYEDKIQEAIDLLISIAMGEVGKTGGRKYTPGGISTDWCAYFVTWVAKQSGLIKYMPKGVGGGRCNGNFRKEYYMAGRLLKQDDAKIKGVSPGDFILFDWDIDEDPYKFYVNGVEIKDTRIQHIGIVIDYDPKTGIITYIDGNGSGGINGPVCIRTMKVDDDNIYGFYINSNY